MLRHIFSISVAVQAAPRFVHGVLDDYRMERPRVLPPGADDYRLLEGGVGDGTVFGYRIRGLGRVRAVRAFVQEPEPGRVLVETEERGEVRTFTMVPAGVEGGTLLTLELSRRHSWRPSGTAHPRLRRAYATQLVRLADFIEDRARELSAR